MLASTHPTPEVVVEVSPPDGHLGGHLIHPNRSLGVSLRRLPPAVGLGVLAAHKIKDDGLPPAVDLLRGLADVQIRAPG